MWNESDYYSRAPADPWYRTIAEIQSAISFATQDFFRSEGLRTLHLPLITSSVSSPMGLGSDSTPVEIDLSGARTYLADSEQLLLEYGCRLFDRGCFCNLPSHRGEAPDHTHLPQFYHAEAEIPGTFEDAIALAERYLRHLARELIAELGPKLAEIAGSLSHIQAFCDRRAPLPRVSLDEAATLLSAADLITHADPPFRTITLEGERKLIERYGGFVWLVDLDHLGAPFYQAFKDSARRSGRAADLLFGVGEVIGLGERHTTADDLREALRLHQVPAEPYEWYIKMRERFPMRTSGFGLGVERFVCWLLQHNDIRDCQLFPRINERVHGRSTPDPGKCTFCQIVGKTAPVSIVHEDAVSLAFMDINPITRGHVVVIPKQHFVTLEDCDENVARHLMAVVKRLNRTVSKAVQCEGVLNEIMNGEAAGQEIFHLHLHVIPRFRNDGFGWHFPAGYRQRVTARHLLDEVAAQICACRAE
ncbi:MAG: asparaginyl-tRNA synthetase [Chthoniobacter sp.]|jgi:aspartyl/asparaginyl-tRNA synthetase/diadenosine tetraphosphate (Ap4A) HIT family hydrolase|nr:asparaginyl-tRNA synthetase [Chthoniobacter sp.]